MPSVDNKIPSVLTDKGQQEYSIEQAKRPAVKQTEPEAELPSFTESIANSISNIGTGLKQFLPNTSVALSSTLETVLGKDLGSDVYGVLAQGDPEVHRMEAYATNERLEKEFKPTRGLIEAGEKFDIPGLAAATVDAGLALVRTGITSGLTAGLGLYSDMVGSSVINYNTAKAKSKGISVDELYERGENEFLLPATLGGAAAQLEKIGLKGVSNAINRKLVGSGAKKAALLFNDVNKEGMTEWVQTGIDKANEVLGRGNSAEVAAEEAAEEMFSKKGLESYLMGVVGSGGASGVGRLAKGMISPKSKEAVVKESENIERLSAEIVNPDISPVAREFVEGQIRESVSKVAEVIEEDVDKVEQMGPTQKQEIDRISGEIEQTEQIINDPVLSEETKVSAVEANKELTKELDKKLKEKPVKVSGTVIESPEGLEQFEFASTELPNGKFAVYETSPGTAISNQYDTEAELLEAFDKNKDKLTVEAITQKIGGQNAIQIPGTESVSVGESPGDSETVEQGVSQSEELTPQSESKKVPRGKEKPLKIEQEETGTEIAEIPLSTNELKRGDTISAVIAGKNVIGKVTDIGEHKGQIVADFVDQDGNQRFVYGRQIQDIQTAPKELPKPDNFTAEQREVYDDVKRRMLEGEDMSAEDLANLSELTEIKESPAPKKPKGEEIEFEEILTKPNKNENKTQRKGRQEGLLTETEEVTEAPAATLTPLEKAERDLASLKQTADKPKKYEGSIKRLTEAKNSGQITEKEFNDFKKKFDQVAGASVLKEVPSKLQSAKDRLAQAKARIDAKSKNVGIASDPKQDAKDLFELHSAYVNLAKEYISEGITSAKDFAKEIGEKLSKAVQDAWDEATGTIKKTLKDFETDSETEDAEVMGITKKELKQIDDYQPQKEEDSRRKSRERADKRLAEGDVNIADLIKKLKKETYRPSPEEMDLVRSYFISLTKRINEKPTPELLAERSDLLKTIRDAGFRAGQTVQAFDGLVAMEDNLAFFLTEESQYAELTQEEVTDLTQKYNAAKAALEKFQAKVEAARQKPLDKKAQSNINKIPRAKVKEDFRQERIKLKQDLRDVLRKARGMTQSTFVPYANELIAAAPIIRKMVVSYVKEGIYDLQTIIRNIHADLKNEMPDVTENDVRDVIAGQYPNPKNTRYAKLAMVRDLETQARLERRIANLEAGILDEKSPARKRKKSEEVNELEAKVREIKKRHPELTYPSRLQGRKTFYENKIRELKNQIAKGEFDPVEPPIPILLDAEALKLKDEYTKFKNETRERRQKKEYEALAKWEQNLKKVKGLLGLRRAVNVSVDLSIPLRQGIAIMLNPRTAKIGIKGYGKMLSAVQSRKTYERMMFDIEQNPAYLESKDDGIIYNEVGAAHTGDEWHQRNPIIDRIPVLRELVRVSEVAAAAWTNYTRFELYQRGTKMLLKEGKTRENSKEAYEQMAARIMTDTGSGSLGFLDAKDAGKAAGIIKGGLSGTFFGPRLYASTFRKLNPLYYFNLGSTTLGKKMGLPNVDRTVRVEALKDMIGYVSAQIMLGLAVAATGATVSLDPDDPDFLKARWGKKVVDLTAGQAVYIRTFLRVMRAVYMQADPSVSHQDAVKYSSYAKKSVETFWRNKLAPNMAYGLDAVMGENTIGEKFDPWEIIKIYPMYADDLGKAIKEGSPLDAATILPIGVLGLGYQEYSKNIRRARLSAYAEDPALKAFLKKNKLNVTGDINQEIYDVNAGGYVKMTQEQSDRYEKIWGQAVAKGIKANMQELSELAEEDRKNEDKEGYTKKLPSAIGRIKAEATLQAKEALSGVTPAMMEIENEGKEYKLSPEHIRERVRLNKEYIESHESDYIQDRENYLQDGLTPEEADIKARKDLRSAANEHSKEILLSDPDFEKEAIID